MSETINLLLLGATGNGKSSFVNALANYMTYSSLEEAMSGVPINLIPLQITTTDDDYETHTVRQGIADENENLDAKGSSATKKAKSYVLQTASGRVRLIDIPGIGDTSGKEADKTNFQQIMTHIRYLEKLHGICLFVDPNSPRLTTYFSFCIEQLIEHLHKDACQNIVFIFTKARGTNYKPGDALPTIRELLKNYQAITLNKNTMYCIDNEAVRYLAMHNKGLKMNKKEMHDSSDSWKAAFSEISRMLTHLSTLKPHLTKSTVSLNEAKHCVHCLVEPMLKIFDNIDKNLKVIQDKKEELNCLLSNDNIDELTAALFLPKIKLISKALSNPRLVCASKTCVKQAEVDGINVEHYTQVCHDNCYLTGLQFLNNLTFLNRTCKVMNEGICTVCWCNWKMHKHIKYEYEEIIENQQNSELHDKANEEQKTKAAKISEAKDFIKDIDNHMKELISEQNKIIDIAATLGIFLQQNSIKGDSDSITEQILESIEHEKAIVNKGADDKKLTALEVLQVSYQKQKDDLQNTGIQVFPVDVQYLIASLYNLKHVGATIEQCAKISLDAHTKMSISQEVVLVCRHGLEMIQKKFQSFGLQIGKV